MGKINVDNNGETASKYNVRSIPTIMVFKNGRKVEQVVGKQSVEALTGMINRHLSP